MSQLTTVTASVGATLNWQYTDGSSRLHALYDKAKRSQWDVASDVDWTLDVPFGEPLATSAESLLSFHRSPLADRGCRANDRFRWELQSWMVAQFLHGEQAALVVAGRLVETLPDIDAKLCAASQAVDEARHVEAFSRYAREKLPDLYPVSPSLAALMRDVLADSRWDITTLGMQILVEALAMAAFRLANWTLHDDLIKRITSLVAGDEARHVSFGVLSLSDLYRELPAAELAEREDLVLEAAFLTRRRFLLAEVWERLDVPAETGAAFAVTEPTMIRYRQMLFAKIVGVLRNIGLLTDRVRGGLAELDLLLPREDARC